MPTSTPFRLTYSELLNLSKKPYTSFFHAHLSAPSHPFHSPHPAQTALQKSHIGSSFGPNDNLEEALLQSRSGRIASHIRMEKAPLGSWGACRELWGLKKGTRMRSLSYGKDTI